MYNLFKKILLKIRSKFKKPVPTLEQALIASIQKQKGELVQVDKAALFHLIEKVKESNDQRQDLTYILGLYHTIENATTQGKTLLEALKTQKNPKETIFFILKNQSSLSELFKALNIILKSSYHLSNIKKIAQKYGRY